MDSSLFYSLPAAIVLWIIVYVTDYYLTLYGQRLWLQNAKQFFLFQGSYELNPYYQNDIDANKRMSHRFFFMLGYGVVWMLFMWGATQYLNIQQVFPAAMGYLLMKEIVVLSSHVQNIRLFQSAAVEGAVEGHISYARWLSMDGTAWKYGYWGLIFLVFAVTMGNWFFIGGALACLYDFFRLRRYGQRLRTQPKAIPTPSQQIVEP